MKQCTKCHLVQPEDQFRKRLKSSDGLASWCKSCYRIWEKSYHKSDTYKKRKQVYSKYRSATFSEFLLDYLKKNPCARCGESDPVVLEFDHLGNKHKPVSLMKFHSLEAVKSEIAKCQVLCANCHRRKTAKDFNWYRTRV